MMGKKIYLLSLRHSEAPFVEAEKEALDSIGNKSMFVIDFARDSEEKTREKKRQDVEYFKKMGAEKIEFASDFDDDEIGEKIVEAGLLYIAGGDTELLLRILREKGLDEKIKDFEGIIVGNSAGTYACCREYVKVNDDGVQVFSGLGLIDICCNAHYTEEFEDELLKLSEGKKIYAVPDNSVIVFEDGELSFRGKIYLFSDGKKEAIN